MHARGFCAVAAVLLLCLGLPGYAQPAPDFRTAASFVVHAHSAVTNSGRTRVTGNVGVSPGKVVSGLRSDAFSAGDIHRDDALARQARVDANAVEDALASRPCTRLDSPSLGGQTLLGKVYCFDAADVD